MIHVEQIDMCLAPNFVSVTILGHRAVGDIIFKQERRQNVDVEDVGNYAPGTLHRNDFTRVAGLFGKFFRNATH